jgi:hypothetical protein
VMAAGAPRAAAVKAGRRGVGAARSAIARPRLDGGEPGARLDGRDDEARAERHDVIPGLGRLQACDNNTASPCIRSGSIARCPNPSCTSEGMAQERRDPSEETGCVVPWMRTVTRRSRVTSADICARPISEPDAAWRRSAPHRWSNSATARPSACAPARQQRSAERVLSDRRRVHGTSG